MKLWRWEHGRQGSGYSKLLLATSKWLKFDLYLLRLPEGIHVPEHRDPSPEGFEHHRVNITLREADEGGWTWIAARPGDRFNLEPRRIYRFRPDLSPHRVDTIRKGSILLLSFGWLKRCK